MRPPLAIVALTLALAGCLSGSPTDDTPSPSAVPTIEYLDCHESQWYGVPKGDVAPYLPPGFAAATIDGAGAAPIWTLIAYECPQHLVDGIAAGAVVESFAALLVTPPDEWTIDNGSRVGGYAMVLFYGTTSEPAHATFADAGIPSFLLEEGGVALDKIAGGLAQTTTRASGGAFAVEAVAVEAGEASAWEGRFVRVFSVGGELREGAEVVGWFDAWVPDREVVGDAAVEYRLEGLSGVAADLLPPAGPALASGWRNAEGLSYLLRFYPGMPA